MPLTSLNYHLDYMVRRRILSSETKENLKKFYSVELDEKDKKVLTALRQKTIREIVLTIMEKSTVNYELLEDRFGLPRSTLYYYLKILVDKDILVRDKIGYQSLYKVKDEERVIKILITYKSTFLDKLVDKVLNTWIETRFHKNIPIRKLLSNSYS